MKPSIVIGNGRKVKIRVSSNEPSEAALDRFANEIVKFGRQVVFGNYVI